MEALFSLIGIVLFCLVVISLDCYFGGGGPNPPAFP